MLKPYKQIFMKLRLFQLVSIALLLVACNKKQAIYVAGSSTVLPIVSMAADEYKKANPAVNIIVSAGGSGVGINQLGEGKIQLAMASRDITQNEIDQFGSINFNPITIGKDAVIPVVSSEIYDAGVQALSFSEIASIYKGEVDNWASFEGPDQAILCIDKETSRGTRHVFMKAIMGDKEALAPGADLVLGSNNEEQTALVQSSAAIGMLSFAWLSDDVKGVSIVLENGDTISPTLDNIVNGTYPIARDLLVISNGQPTGETKAFVDYLFSKSGQNIVTEQGYIGVQ